MIKDNIIYLDDYRDTDEDEYEVEFVFLDEELLNKLSGEPYLYIVKDEK